MIDPEQNLTRDEQDAAEGKPELEAETLKDLTPPEGGAEALKGGQTTGAGPPPCGCGTM